MYTHPFARFVITSLFALGMASAPLLASANTTTLSTDPSYATGPFVFFCDPYTTTFVAGQSYLPDNGAECAFSLSNTISGRKIINIYKGVPGNATLVAGDLAIGYGTLEGEDNVQFGSPAQGTDYFAAEYDYDAIPTLSTYLTSGGDLPQGAIQNQNYYILPWKWGSTPVQSPLTVTADNKVMTAGGTVPTLTATVSGFTGGDTASSNDVTGSPSCTTSGTNASIPGTYPITCTVGSLMSTKYTFTTFVAGTLTIQPATYPLTVTADNKSMMVGGTLPALTATLSGFVGSDTPTSNDITGAPSCITTATNTSPVGTYPITCTVGTLTSAKYTLTTFVAGVFTITRAPLTVTADNKTMTVGAAVPALTATLSGFVGTDTLLTSGVTGAPSCTTSATSASPVGTYPITCTIGTLAAGKYTFATFVAGTLTITYRFDGFLQPINDTAHQTSCHNSDISLFKAGSTVPVKLQLKKADGTIVTATTPPLWLTPQKGAPLSQPANSSVFGTPTPTGAVYTLTGNSYTYNWNTKGLQAGYWYKIYAKLDDGTTVSVIIGLW